MKRRPPDAQQHSERSNEREREERNVQAERPTVEDEIAEHPEHDRRSEKSEPKPLFPTHQPKFKQSPMNNP